MTNLIRARYFDNSCITLQITDPLLDPGFKKLNNTEFLYHGALYDIISENTSNNVTNFVCINDKKEARLLAEFHNFIDLTISQSNPAKAKHTQAMLRHLITLALVEKPVTQPTQYPTELKFFSFNDPLSIILQKPLFHPPDIS